MSQSDWSWVNNMKQQLQAGIRTDPQVVVLDKETQTPGYSTAAISFQLIDRTKYFVEVGTKGKDLIFHFFPKTETFPEGFGEKMGDAFIAGFKNEQKLSAAFVEDLNSWAVKASNYADNPFLGTIVNKVFDELDRLLDQVPNE